jgi:hypothetical protein
MFTPVIIKVINYLRLSTEKISINEIIAIMQDNPDHVNMALDKLLVIGLVVREGDTYVYNCTDRNNELTNRLLRLYKALSRGPSKESFIRGVLCQVPSQYLLHLPPLREIFKAEGIDAQELEDFIQRERAGAYLEVKRILYVKKKIPFIRMCMPPYYFNYLVEKGVICDEKSQIYQVHSSEGELQEEDYLVTQYPQQVEAAAREYLEKERPELADYLFRKGLAKWSS